MKTQHTGTFHELTFEQQVDHVKHVGRRALMKWGYSENATMTLLNFTENATFSVESEEKPKIIMRVHRWIMRKKTQSLQSCSGSWI